MHTKEFSVVIPVYNEEPSVVDNLAKELYLEGFEVIVVNDGGQYKYRRNGVCVVNHITNVGYGKAIKSGVRASTRPYIITADGDGQHTVKEIVRIAKLFSLIECDMLIGQRRLEYERFIRMFGRKCLNLLASFFTSRYMLDLNSGLRVFKRNLAIDYESILCDTYSYTTSFTISMMTDHYVVEWVPISIASRSYGKSKVKMWKDGLITLGLIIKIGGALRTRRLRDWLRRRWIYRVIKHILGQ